MIKRLMTLIFGNTLASLGITMIINAGLGCFSVTAANMAVGNWLGVSLGTAGMIVELTLLAIATYRGEGVGLTSICNAIYGSKLIDVFLPIVPHSMILIPIGLFLSAIGWMYMGKAGYGDTGSNALMNSILKSSKMSIGKVRIIQEAVVLFIGFLGARESVTWFTLLLVATLGPILQFVYGLFKYDPTVINHQYLIKRGVKSKCLKSTL